MERESTLSPAPVGIRLAATRPSSSASAGDYVEKHEGLDADAGDPAGVSEAGNSRHDGTKHDRGDRHAEQLDEAIAQRLQLHRRIGPHRTQEDRHGNGDDHLVV